MRETRTSHGAMVPLPENLPPEEKDERIVLSFNAAVPFLPDGDRIHTFMDGGILIGADWGRNELLAAMKEAEIHVTGETAQRMKHGLAIERPGGAMLFIETNGRTDELFT